MFINLSNHPSGKWCEAERKAASEYGRIVDLKFPAIDSTWDSEKIDEIVQEYKEKVEELSRNKNVADICVLIQGEFVFSYRMIQELKKERLKCVAAKSDRKCVETTDNDGNTVKTSVFSFVKFMEY